MHEVRFQLKVFVDCREALEVQVYVAYMMFVHVHITCLCIIGPFIVLVMSPPPGT